MVLSFWRAGSWSAPRPESLDEQAGGGGGQHPQADHQKPVLHWDCELHLQSREWGWFQ